MFSHWFSHNFRTIRGSAAKAEIDTFSRLENTHHVRLLSRVAQPGTLIAGACRRADRVAGRYYGKAEELFANIGGLFETIGATGLQAAGWCIQVEPAGLQRSGRRVLGFEVAVTCAARLGWNCQSVRRSGMR